MSVMEQAKNGRIVIIGGCGHVGLPLGVKLTLAGEKVVLIDIDEAAVQAVKSGRFPFLEQNGNEQLRQCLERGLIVTRDKKECLGAEVFVFVTGTPVDEHLNPKLSELTAVFLEYQEYIPQGALVIMRSTLFPGTMEHLNRKISELGKEIRFAFCPERVSQGHALEEIESLPQIVSAFDEESFQGAYQVFSRIAPVIIRLSPLEAEITKLMANAWRYIEFAIANQFYMIAEANGVDFRRVHQAIRYRYPRASGYKAPGLAAGPCLFKDTMQLASYFEHKFQLGHSAMLVNEGLASFLVERAKKELGGVLSQKTVGLLGMTFKANNDDTRESLSFKIRKALLFQGAEVLWHDPYLSQSENLESLIARSHVIILCTPHKEYEVLTIEKPVIDVWGMYAQETIEVYPGYERGEER